MANLLKTLGLFDITISKYNGKYFFLLFFNYWSKRLKKNCFVIRYTVQSNLLSELILDLGKCPNQKTHESESADFLLYLSKSLQTLNPGCPSQRGMLTRQHRTSVTLLFAVQHDQCSCHLNPAYLLWTGSLVFTMAPKLVGPWSCGHPVARWLTSNWTDKNKQVPAWSKAGHRRRQWTACSASVVK